MDEKKVFVTGDLHLGHKRLLIYESEFRPYKTIEQMHIAIIKNWNNKITNDSKVFILGDLTFTSQTKTIEVLEKLNGIKYLIKGNHDNKPNQWYRDCGIKEVSDYPILYNNYYLLSHEPMLYLKPPFINVHAHVHSSKNFPTFTPASICVSLERWNMCPISMMSLMLGMERFNRYLDSTAYKFKQVDVQEEK